VADERDGSAEKRPYRQKRRAELEQATRLRITESAVELHGTLGPARTSISAIADHAGVRRSTVYRHFANEKALFTACTAHWRTANPPPDITLWDAVRDPGDRLRTALNEFYAYYRLVGPMLANVLRDEESMPIISEMLSGYRDYLTAVQHTLMRGRRLRGRARHRVRAAIGHALAFSSWQSLTHEQGLDDAQASELMSLLVTAAGTG
jgi:AcrR family transcriptional regulator